MDHKTVASNFYRAFQNGNAEEMASCYHEKVEFNDPAFGDLKGQEVIDMWRMLLERSKGQLQIIFKDPIDIDASTVKVNWEAIYLFSQTGRQVHNRIEARLKFEDGKIIQHNDNFNFWQWASMALGLKGILFGWTPLVKNKVRKQCRYLLRNYSSQSEES